MDRLKKEHKTILDADKNLKGTVNLSRENYFNKVRINNTML